MSEGASSAAGDPGAKNLDVDGWMSGGDHVDDKGAGIYAGGFRVQDKGTIHVPGRMGLAAHDFFTLLRMACDLKLAKCLFLDFLF